ncbi:alpha/beta fold hydrolase [Catenibacterium mitsuokai]|uniref:alpha/beta fold hydrolase n=1 Tax=Catenibacterium mitsuokai TaxID=100886 RepID=UPI003F8FA31D
MELHSGGVFLALAVYFLVQGIRCGTAVRESKNRLAAYNAQTAALSYGEITYVDSGEGEVILSVHGIFGGYDQAYDTCKDFCSDYRIIAPSRFGYLGSDVSGDGTPARQAAAYVELLDKLGIDKVYLLATSAGGSVAIRFALDYPQRAKGLILYCSAMPPVEKPEKYAEYAGPPPFLCNDYIMFLLSPMFDPIMGMEPSTIYSMLPINDRKVGVILDASVTNPDMARDFGEYPIEDLQVPTLIFHAKDDKLASYIETEKAVARFPNCTFISFESGGHLLTGHAEEIKETVSDFVEDRSH